jgi:hypothetical protein
MTRKISQPLVASLILGLGTLVLSSTARADAIDGAWCSADGRHMKIAGPQITTAGGAILQGDYRRHQFSYVAPSNEAFAGETIYLRLAGETVLYMHIGNPLAAPALWKRCETIS